MHDAANSCTTQSQGKVHQGGGEKINHLLFLDDLKLYVKSGNEIKGLVSTVKVFSQDIGMEFGIKKCGVIIMNRGKVKSTDGIELSSGEKIRKIEEDRYKYLGCWSMT